ncbi:MAG: hypothetical protein ACFFG0_53385 [Candidatus Thorarchaeota archaeon]
MSKLNDEKKKQVGVLKGWILRLIDDIDPRMLFDMIKANEIPTLWEYQLPSYLGFVKGLIQEYLPQILEELTVETVIKYADEYRSDLARILSHKKAQIWMNRFLKKTKFMLEHLDKTPEEIQWLYEKKMKELLTAREAQQAQLVDELLQSNEDAPVQQIEKIPAEMVEKQLNQQELEARMEDLSEDELKMILGNKMKDLDFL